MIAIIKYNAGNVTSVQNALHKIGVDNIITSDFETIKNADKVIFPGVGEASSAMQFLKANNLDAVIKNTSQPFLGICLGLQLMCKHSEENNTECLGIFNADVKLFPSQDIVPHMGWNNIEVTEDPLLKGITTDSNFYFVHSYYASLSPETIGTCNYILPFSAALQYKNFYATQFHPEKSATDGEIILKNFLNIK
jgi:imidazole glycerol-phosphate synthase subunit HisH